MIRSARFLAGLGPIAATVEAGAVVRIELLGESTEPMAEALGTEDASLLARLFLQLEEYAHGKRREFTVPWRLGSHGSDLLEEPMASGSRNVTPFTLQVLEECARLPFGLVVSYGEMAQRIGNPGAVRAVGGALGRNPLPILVPCHRVLAANGLGGFSGGQDWKCRLLEIEGALPQSLRESMQSP